MSDDMFDFEAKPATVKPETQKETQKEPIKPNKRNNKKRSIVAKTETPKTNEIEEIKRVISTSVELISKNISELRSKISAIENDLKNKASIEDLDETISEIKAEIEVTDESSKVMNIDNLLDEWDELKGYFRKVVDKNGNLIRPTQDTAIKNFEKHLKKIGGIKSE